MKIKKPVVNYLKLRPSNVNTPEYKHVWLLLGWVWYLTMFVLTEHFISPERCHVVHSFMDDVIPFREGFIIFYDSWYVLLVGTIAYFLFYDVESFVRVQKFIILTQIIGVRHIFCGRPSSICGRRPSREIIFARSWCRPSTASTRPRAYVRHSTWDTRWPSFPLGKKRTA